MNHPTLEDQDYAPRAYPARGIVMEGAALPSAEARLGVLHQAVEDAETVMRFGSGGAAARMQAGLDILRSFPVHQARRTE